jgi:hypothetical protein
VFERGIASPISEHAEERHCDDVKEGAKTGCWPASLGYATPPAEELLPAALDWDAGPLHLGVPAGLGIRQNAIAQIPSREQ